MTAYLWNVASGNFGAASSWSPTGTPTSADSAGFDMNASIFGSGSAGSLNFFGNITVTISAALSTTTGSVYVGSTVGSGLATVDVDAAWTNSSAITVGYKPGSAGALFVNAGGSVTTNQVSIGSGYNSGAAGAGAVTVDGGQFQTTQSWDEVGGFQGGMGTLTITGSGSSWKSGGTLNIGDAGTGTLYVENGATLNAVNLNTGVNYDQSTIASGSGTTYIESGGVVTTTGAYQEIGNDATGAAGDVNLGATGAVTVDGSGSKWIATNGAIEVGDVGSKQGSLTISNHGNVTATNEFDVGDEYISADGSYGTLLIESGGTAVTGGYVVGGSSYDTIGSNIHGAADSTVTVTGSGSSWKMDATLSIDGSAQVTVASGGTIEAETGVGLFGGSLLKVDGSSTFEDGTAGGAALGFLTVDPVSASSNANFYGNGTVDANVVDNGKIYATDGVPLIFNGATGGVGAITGAGVLLVGTEATLILNASVAATDTIKFRGWDGTLELGDPSAVAAPIDNFNAGDIIDLEGVAYNSGSSSYTFTPSGSNGGGTLVVNEGSTHITLKISSSPQSISGKLTLGADQAGTGTDVTFTNGAAQSPFNLWSSVGSLFNTTGGTVNGEDYANSNSTDGGAPIWVETETPASSYVAGGANTYTIVLATQDWIGDIQPEITVATDSNLINSVTSTSGAPFSNLATAIITSNTSTQGTGGVVYWTASTTSGDYALKFQPLTVTYPTTPATANFVSLTNSQTTMLSAVADPLAWSVSNQTSSSMVLAYMSGSGSSESLYMEGFTAGGVATNAGPVLIASGLPVGTPYFIGYNSSGYGYRYMEVGGALGTGLVGGTFNTTTGALGTASLFLALPSFTAFNGVSSRSISNGNTLRLVEGVSNGKAVLQSFLNNNSTPEASFNLASASDYFQSTSVFDVNDTQLDYTVVAYTDAGKVHLELLDENGAQIGGDLVVPGLSSFYRLHTLQGSTNGSSTRVELDYAVPNASGGQTIQALIYDTNPAPDVYTIGAGLSDGTPFNDTITWGPGVAAIDGGGGSDTFVATNLSASQVTLKIDAAGETVLSDGSGDIDTLRRFSQIDLSNATVTISGQTLTEVFSDGSKVVTVYDAAGAALSVKSYNTGGTLVSVVYPAETPDDFTGDGRSDVLFLSQTGQSASSGTLATWQVNDTAITGGGAIGNPGAAWTFESSGQFYGDGYSDALFRNQSGQLALWKVQGTAIVAGAAIGNPGAGWNVVGTGDFNGDGDSDILFEDAKGDLADWLMNGAAIVGGGTLGNPGAGWSFRGLGDFNGDGKTDVLFENASGVYATWTVNGTQITGGATLGNPGAGWVYKGIGNFNGLGDSDILFENTTTGAYATWDISNDAISGGGTLGSLSSAWTFAAIGNYAANGKSDVLFRNTVTGQYATWDVNDASISGGGTLGNPGASNDLARGSPAAYAEPAPTITFLNSSGTVATWTISNGAITGGGTLGSPGAGWTSLAVGDFYGDGQSDVLFENANGTYASWRTNGSAITGGGNIGSASGYTFKGLGDFNGDGISDLLFENASGNYATWEMNGTSIIGGAGLGNPGAGFTYAGTGDFTGDGTSDILLTDSSGNYWIWYVNNGSTTGSAEIGNPGAGWALKGIGDLNGDGKADLVFENASGSYSSWDLNNATIVGGGPIGNPGSGWTLAGVAALNAAGFASLVFENASGQVATWLMNDNQIAGGATLGTASGYTVLGAR